MTISSHPRPRPGMAFSGRHPSPSILPRSALGAFVEGGLDNITFGLDDQLKAGVQALYDTYKGKSLADGYRRRIQAQHEYDRIDAERRPTARNLGKGAGTVLQLAASGPLGAMVRGGARIAEVTPLALREVGALAGVGGIGGVATRAGVDKAHGHASSWGDLAAAGLGGGLEALLSRSGNPGHAGAVSGAATSIAEDVFNGRAPSWRRAFEAAGQGRFLGSGVGAIGRKSANALPSTAKQAWLSKENLGEWASKARTRARGDRTASTVKSREHLAGGGFTLPDQRTLAGQLVESKFGWWARLTHRQKQAFKELGPTYRVDHLLPDDIGSLIAFPAAQIDYHWGDQRYRE